MKKDISTIGKLYNALLDNKLVEDIRNNAVFSDEPQGYIYGGILTKSSPKLLNNEYVTNTYNSPVGGYSLTSPEKALLRCLGEAMERTSLFSYNKNTVKYASCKTVGMCDFIDCYVNRFNSGKHQHKKYGWISAKELTTCTKTYIPAQIVFLNYLDTNKEQVLAPVVSTGTAGWSDPTSAILKGIYEVIERDSIMTSYLLQAPLPKISTASIKRLDELDTMLKDYQLQWHLFDATNDLGIPVYLSIIQDETGYGPAFTFGSSADFRKLEAIIRSMEEALMSRPWGRMTMFKEQVLAKADHNFLRSRNERMICWSSASMEKHISYLLSQKPRTIRINTDEKYNNPKKTLFKLCALLKSKEMSIYETNITINALENADYYVYKITIPELQPLYISDDEKVVLQDRMKSVARHFGIRYAKLNKISHPFL